jgi:hypothetical protein
MPRYGFLWYDESTSHVSFDAAHISSATEYFEDLQNGNIQLEDLPNMKGKWKNGQTEYLDLHEIKVKDDSDIYTIKEKVEIEYDPDAEYKRQLEESIPELEKHND